MADYKSCEDYAACEYRIGTGQCPEGCNKLRLEEKPDVVYCRKCSSRGNARLCPLLSLVERTEEDDYCSFGMHEDDIGTEEQHAK